MRHAQGGVRWTSIKIEAKVHYYVTKWIRSLKSRYYKQNIITRVAYESILYARVSTARGDQSAIA